LNHIDDRVCGEALKWLETSSSALFDDLTMGDFANGRPFSPKE